MKLLVIDTATDVCGVGLMDDARLVADVRLNQRNIHNERLLQAIEWLAQQAGWRLDQLDAIAYAKGPGSFTGLRIGLAICKGLAFTLEKPMIGVNTLDALALAMVGREGPVAVYLKARQTEGYFAIYRHSLNSVKRDGDFEIVAREEISQRLDKKTVLISVPWDFVADIPSDGLRRAPRSCSWVQPTALATLARDKWQKREFDDPESAEPFYLKDFVPKRKVHHAQ